MYFQFAALSLLIVGGLVASASWLFVVRSAGPMARTWFAAIALHLMAGTVLFTAGLAWREMAYFIAVIITFSSLYLSLYSALLMQGRGEGAGKLYAVWLTHLALFIVLNRVAPSTRPSYLFAILAATVLELCVIVTLVRVRKQERMTATLFAELAFGAVILANIVRIFASIHDKKPIQYMELSIYSVISMSLQCVFIIMSCFYYIGISIQRAEGRELEMRIEADRLRVQQRLAEEHARQTAQLIAERDHMMLLNSRFSTMNTLSLLGGGVVHEIAQPLQAARSAVDVLALQEAPTPQDVARQSAVVLRLIDRTAGIVENLRRLMREKTVDLQDVDCMAIINRVFPIVRSEARRRNIEARCMLDPAAQSRLVRANPVMLERVLFNLAANAIEAFDDDDDKQHANGGGAAESRMLAIRMDVVGANGQTSLAIGFDDTGRGVPDTRYAEIFDLLSSGRAEGIGLGLYMVKTFVESWKGTIKAGPNLVAGQGTSVEIVLPVILPRTQKPDRGAGSAEPAQ